MPYQTPTGDERVWTYLPSTLVWELRRLAVEHRRRLPQELQVAVEEYIARQGEKPQGKPQGHPQGHPPSRSDREGGHG